MAKSSAQGAIYLPKKGVLLKSMQKQLLYSDAEYARVKWYLVSSGREGTIEDIINVTRNGVLKAGQIQEQLHQEGIIDLYEVRELDE